MMLGEFLNTFWLQLKVITWKNLVIRKHHWLSTLLEIAIPTAIFALIAFVQAKSSLLVGRRYINRTTYAPIQTSREIYGNLAPTTIYYVPKIKLITELMEKAKPKLNAEAVVGFHSEGDLLTYYETEGHNKSPFMAVMFKSANSEELPKNLHYVIRPFCKDEVWDIELFGMEGYRSPGRSHKYFQNGIISIQMALDTTFAELRLNKKLPFEITMQEFPYPPYFDDLAGQQLLHIFLPVATELGFIVLIVSVSKRVSEEKFTGIKELMKMMGMQSWMLWLGWFVHSLMVIVVSVVLITMFMKAKLWGAKYAILEHCSESVFAVFLLLFCISGTLYCFFICSFFNRPTVAINFGLIFWSVPSFVGAGVLQTPGMKWGWKVLMGVFPTVTVNLGYKAITAYETTRIGAHWSNLFDYGSGDSSEVTLGAVFVIFLLDCVLFLTLTFYFENISPGQYGVAKPFYYPIAYIWTRICGRGNKVEDDDDEAALYEYHTKIEAPPNSKVGIDIKNLHKSYGKTAAVTNLSIDIYEAQITALLGHNGAGKTTTMLVVTGMTSATSGRVLVNNRDIKYNMSQVRKLLGFCPQHNLHFHDLTVLEHLMFFCMLKGFSRNQAKREAMQLLRSMNLRQKRNSRAASLSGGMKRKLSLGMALIGDSKVLILDEPTSGLDPEACRDIWDMLLKLRGSRTIIITTHSMEEADVLGDRIAIMDHGRLVCYGTSMFLKKEYGTGYCLALIRDEDSYKSRSGSHPNQVEAITQVVKGRIKNAVLQSANGNSVKYQLPYEMKPNFGDLLDTVERMKSELCITNMALSIITLEEVFLRVGDEVAKGDTKRNSEEGNNEPGSSGINNDFVFMTDSSPKCTGFNLLRLQLWSLFKKRWYVFTHKWLMYVVTAIAAILIALLTLYLSQYLSKSNHMAELQFDLHMYGSTLVFYGAPSSDSSLQKVADQYSGVVKRQSGKPEQVPSVSTAIIKKGIENIGYYLRLMVVAAEFNSTGKVINALYSNEASHGAPISLNLLMNAILKGLVGDEYSISTSIHPLPVLSGTRLLIHLSSYMIGMLWMQLFTFGILLLPSTIMIFPLTERINGLKHLQLMCGIRSIFYWLVCYCFDLILYLITVCLILFFMLCYGFVGSNVFSGPKQLWIIFIVLLAYGISAIPYAYLFSYKKTSTGAFTLYLMVTIILSIAIPSAFLVYIVLIGEIRKYNHLLRVVLLFPHVGLMLILTSFAQKTAWNYDWDMKTPEQKSVVCLFLNNPCCNGDDDQGCIDYRSYFKGYDVISNKTVLALMALSSLMYFTILLLLETQFVRKLWEMLLTCICNHVGRKRSESQSDLQVDREEVEIEADRIADLLQKEKTTQKVNEDDEILLVHGLEKMYFRHKAVKGVSFAVSPGECFGVIGVNGAGKTTTFRVLTGDVPLLTGEARILLPNRKRRYLSRSRKQFLKSIGYCPQFDAISEALTGRQMLRLFAELRGITEGKEDEINKWLRALAFEEYADKQCGHYSGGNKRKLSVAMALIGGLPLVILDEPTCGVDPVSRRKLWNTLADIQKQKVKPSIVLTSHSMEESEALCNKLVIMKAGRVECYGTIPNIKKMYAQGFTVMLKLKQSVGDGRGVPQTASNLSGKSSGKVEDSVPVKNLMRAFEETYKGMCTLRDKHTGMVTYHINDRNKRWGQVFKEIEQLQHQNPIIEDYNISETTLEEVFLSIARADD